MYLKFLHGDFVKVSRKPEGKRIRNADGVWIEDKPDPSEPDVVRYEPLHEANLMPGDVIDARRAAIKRAWFYEGEGDDGFPFREGPFDSLEAALENVQANIHFSDFHEEDDDEDAA